MSPRVAFILFRINLGKYHFLATVFLFTLLRDCLCNVYLSEKVETRYAIAMQHFSKNFETRHGVYAKIANAEFKIESELEPGIVNLNESLESRINFGLL